MFIFWIIFLLIVFCFYSTSCLYWFLLEMSVLSVCYIYSILTFFVRHYLRLLSTSLSIKLPCEHLAFHVLTTKLSYCDTALCLMINKWLCIPQWLCKHCVNLVLEATYIRIISSLLILPFFVRCYFPCWVLSIYSHKAIDMNLHVGRYTCGIPLSAHKF